MKYNELKINWGGNKYVFVTRGRARPFTEKEALDYLGGDSDTSTVGSALENPLEEEGIIPTEREIQGVGDELAVNLNSVPDWRIKPDTRQRRDMFMRDVRQGIEFTMAKYGISRDQIESEVRRIAPYKSTPSPIDG